MKYINNRLPKGTYWVIAAICVILLRLILPATWIEAYYTRGIFQLIRLTIDHTVGLLPFPTVYLFAGFLILYFIKNGLKLFRSKNLFLVKLRSFAWSTLVFISITIFLFLTLWGFNYGRVPIEDQMGFTPKPLDYKALKEELSLCTIELINARNKIPNATDSVLNSHYLSENSEELIRADLVRFLERNDFPTNGRVRGRLLHPKGVLLRISTAGVYLPWIGEGHIDPGMHPIQIPFVMAHEMSHGYGFTDEGTCNFTAYLALRDSQNPFFKYSAILGYWNYLARAIYWYDEAAYKEFYANLPLGVRNDRKIIRAYLDRYPDIMPVVRDAFYNQYLKTQGIEEGMKNYSRVVMLAAAYRKKQEE